MECFYQRGTENQGWSWKGIQLLVEPAGAKLWQLVYQFQGRQRQMALGPLFRGFAGGRHARASTYPTLRMVSKPRLRLRRLGSPRSKPHRRDLESLVDDMQTRIRHHLGRTRMAALEGASRSRTALEPRLQDMRDAMADRHIQSLVACDPGLFPGCEAGDTDEIFETLIDNAFIWATTHVEIAAAQVGNQVAIRIDDDGKGLPAHVLGELTQPGKRLDETVPDMVLVWQSRGSFASFMAGT